MGKFLSSKAFDSCVLIFFWFIKFRYSFYFEMNCFFVVFPKIHMDVLVELHWYLSQIYRTGIS